MDNYKSIVVGVDGQKKQHPVYVGIGALEQLDTHVSQKAYSSIHIVSDEIVWPLVQDKLGASLPIDAQRITLIPTGEQHKSAESLTHIWQSLQQQGADRSSLVILVGGGVVGDIGAFAASTYMRGIDYVLVPTTLLAQVDASVGGKTAIDLSGVKNLVGTFATPSAVIIDPSTLGTLPKRQLNAGFAEIIKHGLIKDAAYYALCTSKQPADFTPQELSDIIARSVEIKSQVVIADPLELGERKILNFGHTIGHAIESIMLDTSNPIEHGEAIALGMCAEGHLSHQLGNISAQELTDICTRLQRAGLPTKIHVSTHQVLDQVKTDKKNVAGQDRFVLLQSVGSAVYDQQMPTETVIKALDFITL